MRQEVALSERESRVAQRLRKMVAQLKTLEERPGAQPPIMELIALVRNVQQVSFIVTEDDLRRSNVMLHLKAAVLGSPSPVHVALQAHPALRDELTVLYQKWGLGDLDNHPDRGLIIRNGRVISADRQWPYWRSDDFYGSGHLVTGQTWFTRSEMSRDGAHSALVAGICGCIRKGARSVVIGLHGQGGHGNYYADVDEGDKVGYVGTEGQHVAEGGGFDISWHTRMLLKSIETELPVRLFRSAKLAPISKYRPAEGYRYDGIYGVRNYDILDKERKIYRFQMRRLPGQSPLLQADMRTSEETPRHRVAREHRNRESARRRRELRDLTR